MCTCITSTCKHWPHLYTTLVWTCEQLPVLTCSHNVNRWWHPKLNFFFFLRILMRVCLVHCQQSPMHMYSRNSLAFITPILIQQCSQFSVYIYTVGRRQCMLLQDNHCTRNPNAGQCVMHVSGGGVQLDWMYSSRDHLYHAKEECNACTA